MRTIKDKYAIAGIGQTKYSLNSGRSELQLGALEPVRDFNYVTNTVDGFLAAAGSEAAIGMILNVGTGVGITIEQLARLAMRIVGQEVPIRSDKQRFRPANSEVYTLLCDYNKAKGVAGWEPAIDLESGLRRTADFIKRHLDLFRPQEYVL